MNIKFCTILFPIMVIAISCFDVTKVDTYFLDLSVKGKGQVITNPSGSDFTPGTNVQIIAVPEKDYVFKSWSGDIENASFREEISVIMNDNRSITAHFVKLSESVILDTGECLIHGSVYLDGYYFLSTDRVPAKLIRANANDLSDYQSITFSSELEGIGQIVYSESKRKIYAAFETYNGLVIGEIDPWTLAYDELKFYDSANTGHGFITLATEGDYLFTTSYYGTSLFKPYTSIQKYSLKTMSSTPVASLKLDSAFISGHSMQISDGILYVTGVSIPPWIVKIRTSDMKLIQKKNNIDLDGGYTDDFAVTDNYMFLGPECNPTSSHSGIIHRVSLNDISNIFPISTGVKPTGSGLCYGVYFDGTFVWAVFATAPGILTKIDPNSLKYTNYELDFDYPNEILSDGNRLLVTYWESDPAVIQAIDISYLKGREIE